MIKLIQSFGYVDLISYALKAAKEIKGLEPKSFQEDIKGIKG